MMFCTSLLLCNGKKRWRYSFGRICTGIEVEIPFYLNLLLVWFEAAKQRNDCKQFYSHQQQRIRLLVESRSRDWFVGKTTLFCT